MLNQFVLSTVLSTIVTGNICGNRSGTGGKCLHVTVASTDLLHIQLDYVASTELLN